MGLRLPFNSLLTSVFAHLTLDTNVEGTVYDFVPHDVEYPAIILSLQGPAGQITKGFSAFPVTLIIEIYSSYNGWKECNDIMTQITESLTSDRLTLEDGFETSLPVMDEDNFQLFAEVDPQGRAIRHGTIGFSFLICDSSQ